VGNTYENMELTANDNLFPGMYKLSFSKTINIYSKIQMLPIIVTRTPCQLELESTLIYLP